MLNRFPHKQLSHCENGTICNLLNFHGFEISEPLIFGIGSGIFFAHMPFVKNQNIPLTSYRIYPGKIFRNATKRLGIKMVRKQYKDKHIAMEDLDEILSQGQPVGLLTNLYYLPFFPKSYRFHYNAHNTIIYGKKDDYYLVSDPVLEQTTRIKYDDLLEARFAKGILKVNGDLYYPRSIPEQPNIKKAILAGIKNTCNLMVRNPIPFHGVNGIHYIAKRIRKWKRSDDKELLYLILGNIVRMQEETGTGGAGFRFMYAAFLQEVGAIFNNEILYNESIEMTKAGHQWREFAYRISRIIKGRDTSNEIINSLGEILADIAMKENRIFKTLLKLKIGI